LRTLSLASFLRVAVAALLPAFVSLSTLPAHAQAPASAPAEAASTVSLPAITPVPMAGTPASAAKKNGDAVDNPYGIEALVPCWCCSRS
jgi:hypothetical protein